MTSSAQCNRMIPSDQAIPRTCVKCGLGPCHLGLTGQAQGLGKEHVQQPIAGMAPLGPTRTEPSNPLRPIEPGPKPIYQMTSRELRDKLRQEQWQQALVVEQPKPEHWEVCHMAFPISHPGWLTQVTPGWEPFAVYNGVLWLKRRVP